MTKRTAAAWTLTLAVTLMTWALAVPALAQNSTEQRSGTAGPAPTETASPSESADPTTDQFQNGTTDTSTETDPSVDDDFVDVTTDTEGDETGGIQQYYIFIVLGGMLLLFFIMGRKPRQEEKKRQEMLSNIKKGDKVTTIGGIVGTIVDVRDKEIVVKIDENTNTRMKFLRSAIRSVGELPEDKDSK